MLVAVASGWLLSGCSVLASRVSVNTSVPLIYGGWLTMTNSAGDDIEITPQYRGMDFVEEYVDGKRHWACLWLCREKIPVEKVVLAHGDTKTVSVSRSRNRSTVEVPVELKVKEQGRVIGFYTARVCVYPDRDSFQTLNFDENRLQQMRYGSNETTLCR